MATPTALNAVDFGMRPNTGADQTRAFQAAIDAAQAQGLPLFVPGGTYDIAAVNITSEIEIYGTQRAAVFRGFRRAPQFNIAPAPRANHIHCVKLSGIWIDGGHQAFPNAPSDSGLIQAHLVDSLLIEDCLLERSARHGLFLHQSAGQVTANTIGASGTAGIFALDSKFVFDSNLVIDSANGGILVWRSSLARDDSIVVGNTIMRTRADRGGTGPWGNGVNVFRAGFVSVTNNTIADCALSAIRFNEADSGRALGNTCTRSGEVAIWMESPGGSFEGGIIGNNIIDHAGGGIDVSNFPGHRVVVSNNQVSNIVVQDVTPGYRSVGRGIAAETGDVLVVGNQLENVADWGITLIPFSGRNGKTIAQATGMLKNCAGGIGFVKDNPNTAVFIGGNTIHQAKSDAKFAAIAAYAFDGRDGSVTRLPGAADLGNATASGFANVALQPNFSFN